MKIYESVENSAGADRLNPTNASNSTLSCWKFTMLVVWSRGCFKSQNKSAILHSFGPSGHDGLSLGKPDMLRDWVP